MAEIEILEQLLANHMKEFERLVEMLRRGLTTDEVVSRAEREILKVKLRVMEVKRGQ